jgi:hypothetical protein
MANVAEYRLGEYAFARALAEEILRPTFGRHAVKSSLPSVMSEMA